MTITIAVMSGKTTKTTIDLDNAGKEWTGWRIQNGLLIAPECIAYTPGEIRASTYQRQLISELTRQLKEPKQWELL